MQIVDNTYQVADGYFISNYISEEAFEAENLIFPAMLIVMYIGLMFGTGASALIAKVLGEGHKDEANRILSGIMLVLTVIGFVLSAGLYVLLPVIARRVGASEALLPSCVLYGRTLAFFMPFQMLSMAFQPLLILAERPDLGLKTTIANAAVNIVLDWVFIALLHWGMRGAAVATGLAWLIGAAIPFMYFINQKHSLHFTGSVSVRGALGKTLYNGASEMVDAVSYAIVAMIFNLRLLKYLGEDGVGAYAVSSYVGGLFAAVFYGVSMSIVPVVAYHLGEKNAEELHSLRKNGFILMSFFGIIMAISCAALAFPVSKFFVGYDKALTVLAVQPLRYLAPVFLAAGITTFSSSYFTGLNQGSASLAIAAVKGFLGPIAAVFLLPLFWGPVGLWLATLAAEVLALITTVLCFLWWNKNEDQKLQEAVEED
jgi:Na+-driven multidrug efflux pump